MEKKWFIDLWIYSEQFRKKIYQSDRKTSVFTALPPLTGRQINLEQ